MCYVKKNTLQHNRVICIKLAELLRRDSKKIISANFFHDISSAEIPKLLFTFYIETAIENCVSMISQITGCTNTECTTTCCTTTGCTTTGCTTTGCATSGCTTSGCTTTGCTTTGCTTTRCTITGNTIQGVQIQSVHLKSVQLQAYNYRVLL